MPPGYDGFLTKPFSMDDLNALLTASKPAAVAEKVPDALNETTFVSLKNSMGADQIMALYTLCLDDAVRRIGLMRQAWTADDEPMFVREAHAIKGGCGMVGATELYHLAAAMEEQGFQQDAESGTVLGSLDGFVAASERLRRILNAHS
jgi:HPt (histidine-containing phosphotransfer) domain-containing protein